MMMQRSAIGTTLAIQPLGVVRTSTMGLPVDAFPSLDSVITTIDSWIGSDRPSADHAFLVTFVNPASIAIAERIPGFLAALHQFGLVLPDGIGMAMAASRLSGHEVARISFDSTSLAMPVLSRAAERSTAVALIGGKAGVAGRAAKVLARSFPGIRIAGAWSGYGGMEQTVNEVLQADPEIVICGMGAPLQEDFLIRLEAAGWRGAGFTCGGYLDQLCDGMRYYPAWVDRTNLRWAYRLAREPRRLWKRYFFDYGRFALRFASAYIVHTLRVEPAHATRSERYTGGGN